MSFTDILKLSQTSKTAAGARAGRSPPKTNKATQKQTLNKEYSCLKKLQRELQAKLKESEEAIGRGRIKLKKLFNLSVIEKRKLEGLEKMSTTFLL